MTIEHSDAKAPCGTGPTACVYAPETTVVPTQTRKSSYKRPSMKSNMSMEQLASLTKEESSLERYRRALLGEVCAPANDPRVFVIEKIQFICELSEQEEIALKQKDPKASSVLVLYTYDFTSDASETTASTRQQLANDVLRFPEGCLMRVVILFRIQHVISSNLRYTNSLSPPSKDSFATLKRFFSSLSMSSGEQPRAPAPTGGASNQAEEILEATHSPRASAHPASSQTPGQGLTFDAFMGSYGPRKESFGWSSEYYEISMGIGRWFSSNQALEGELLFRDDDHAQLDRLTYKCMIVCRAKWTPPNRVQ